MFDLKKIVEDAIKPFKARLEEAEKLIKDTNEKVTKLVEAKQ